MTETVTVETPVVTAEKQTDINANVVSESVACFLVDDLTTRTSIIKSFSGKLIFSGKVETTVYKEETGNGNKYLSLQKTVSDNEEGATSFILKKFSVRTSEAAVSSLESKTTEFSNSKEAKTLVASMSDFSESEKKPFVRKVEKHFVRGLEITVQELTKKNMTELGFESKSSQNYVITMRGSGPEITAWIAMMGVKNHGFKSKMEFFI